MKKFISSVFFIFTLFSVQAFTMVAAERFYGTWGTTNNNGQLVTIEIQPKQVELNVYQIADKGYADFSVLTKEWLNYLETQLVVVSSDAALFSSTDNTVAVLKFSEIDGGVTANFYLYLEKNEKTLTLKAHPDSGYSEPLRSVIDFMSDGFSAIAPVSCMFRKIE